MNVYPAYIDAVAAQALAMECVEHAKIRQLFSTLASSPTQQGRAETVLFVVSCIVGEIRASVTSERHPCQVCVPRFIYMCMCATCHILPAQPRVIQMLYETVLCS